MSKRTSADSGWAGLITEMSSVTFLATTCGDSWINSAFVTLIGCPTNSGRSCINIFKPKNPQEIATQLNNAAVIGAVSGLRESRCEGDVGSSPAGWTVAVMADLGRKS